LVAAIGFVPGFAQTGLLDLLGPGSAHAQGGASSVTTITYTYDDKGNMLSRSDGSLTDTYTYDAEKRLVAADVRMGPNPGAVTYAYDADGNRIAKTAGGVTTTYLVDRNRSGAPCEGVESCSSGSPVSPWSPDQSVAQVLVENEGGAVRTYTYGLDLVGQIGPQGARFYHYDGQFSTRHLTDAFAQVTDAYTYDAFGILLASNGSTLNDYLYAGEQLDPNVGFYYLRARYYAQETGRFTTTDPLQGSIFDPVSLHRYLYANADPVNHRDPTGQESLISISTANVIAGILAATAGVIAGGITYSATGSVKLALAVGFITAAIVFGAFLVRRPPPPDKLKLVVDALRAIRTAKGPQQANQAISAAQGELTKMLNQFVVRRFGRRVDVGDVCKFMKAFTTYVGRAAGTTIPGASSTGGGLVLPGDVTLLLKQVVAPAFKAFSAIPCPP
ncbi:MAG: RHS repeat-associated core domain-containing protein, partial [Candidatus Binatia bacterium]